MGDLFLSALPWDGTASPVEIVEQKGVGHPDSICDSIAEAFSAELCRVYRERFGAVYHHNVDKALLRAGRSRAAFGGGEVLEPMEITVAGRATSTVRGVTIAPGEILERCGREWLSTHLHALDAHAHVKLVASVRPGSPELVDLWERARESGDWLSNDTSFGTGFAPYSMLERAVLSASSLLVLLAGDPQWMEVGEDTKVMGVRKEGAIELTIACAFIGRHLRDLDAYLAHKRRLEAAVASSVSVAIGREVKVSVNAADEPSRGQVYLTVTGASGEAGDDGQVGRGNRYNGLITPYRAMSLEAIAGKNPVTHAGKIYSVVAHRIAHALVDAVPEIAEARCTMLSRIGRPIQDPELVEVQLKTRSKMPAAALRPMVSRVIAEALERSGSASGAGG